MKKSAIVVAWWCCVPLAWAQERIPVQEAEQIAQLLAEHAAKVDNPQLKTDVDASKPYGLRKGGIGIMILPDKKLSADLLAKASKDVTPIGQLWMRNLAPHVDGKTAGTDRLRMVTVTANNEDHKLPLFFLGVRKKGNEDLEVVVFARDKEPLLVLPATRGDMRQELPLELEARKGEAEKTGIITINILGKYQARVTVGVQEP